MDQGFDEFFGFTDATHAWEKFPSKLWHGRELKPVSGHSDDLFTDHAVDFLKRRKSGPFFLYVPYIASHFNIEAPEDEIALHRGKFPEKDAASPLNATYAAMVTRLDKNVGRILDTLDDLGLSNDTLVVFTSDHGATFEQGNLGTSNFHDSNCAVSRPKTNAVGRRTAGAGRRALAGTGAVGQAIVGDRRDDRRVPDSARRRRRAVDPAWKVDGANVLATWRGTAPSPDRTVFWEWRSEGSNMLAALHGRFKLTITNGGRAELFDVTSDPSERRNVIAEHPEPARRLQNELNAWLATERQD